MTAYRNKYGVDPDFLSAQGFDAGTMLVGAIRRAQNEGTIGVKDAFLGIQSYKGLTGELAVDKRGEVDRRFAVVQLAETGLKELSAEPRLITSPGSPITGEVEVVGAKY